MLWMRTYLFYCSVRLGVIVVSLLTFLQLFIGALFLLIVGVTIFEPLVNLFKEDNEFKNNVVLVKIFKWLEDYPNNFVICLSVYFFTHMFFCLLASIGAIKLKKYLLLPFIITEIVRVTFLLAIHIILMIALKKTLNLGVLIAFTLGGSFAILYLYYNCAACIALYQIIELISSQRYKLLYGEDPFHPQIPEFMLKSKNQFAYGTIENVHVLRTPDSNDIDELKHKIGNQTLDFRKQEVIAVLPANNNYSHVNGGHTPILSNVDRAKKRKKRWWQQVRTQNKRNSSRMKEDQPDRQSPVRNLNAENWINKNSEYSVNYGHWQYSELVAPNSKQYNNALIGSNWQWNY